MKKLSINFNNTFGPNRLLMSKLLEYINTTNECSLEDIKNNTGITNGKTTGKVQPYLYYLSGMGLIDFDVRDNRFVVKITSFGKEVLIEDSQLSLNITQWICHAFMCNKEYGSDVWINFFLDWKKDETRYLNQIINQTKILKSKYTPLLNMYLNEDGFSNSKIIYSNDKKKLEYNRNSAPFSPENIPGYGALLIYLLLNNFSKEQVSILDFENKTGFSNIFGWDSSESELIYNSLAGLGYIKISALIEPKCIQSLVSEEYAWKMLYSEIF